MGRPLIFKMGFLFLFSLSKRRKSLALLERVCVRWKQKRRSEKPSRKHFLVDQVSLSKNESSCGFTQSSFVGGGSARRENRMHQQCCDHDTRFERGIEQNPLVVTFHCALALTKSKATRPGSYGCDVDNEKLASPFLFCVSFVLRQGRRHPGGFSPAPKAIRRQRRSGGGQRRSKTKGKRTEELGGGQPPQRKNEGKGEVNGGG